MTTSRQCVGFDKLIEIINAALQTRDETRDCRMVGSVTRLPSPLSDGGNWNRAIAIGGRPSDPTACGEAAHEIITTVARDYNLL